MFNAIVKTPAQLAPSQVARIRVLSDLAARLGSPLLVLDPVELDRRYHSLAAALPSVELHFAVKALSRPEVVTRLADQGASFDVASIGELDLVRSLGVEPERVLFTHPIKLAREIELALEQSSGVFVADNIAELEKLARYRNRASVIIRVSFPNRDARVDLSRKFGCSPAEFATLVRIAREFRLSVVGLCFNIGSQVGASQGYQRAIEWSRQQFENVLRPEESRLLDIGGGFPARYDDSVPDIEDFCAPIRSALATLPPAIRVIAEPGRFLVAPAVSAVVSVVGKAWREGRFWYYLDDGLYGSYSGQVYDGASYDFWTQVEGPAYPSVFAGPTCDSFDLIAEDIAVPELAIGDLLFSPLMGAYTAASATRFNSLREAQFVSLDDDGGIPEMVGDPIGYAVG